MPFPAASPFLMECKVNVSPPDNVAYQFVSNVNELQALAKQWSQASYLAIDTEFIRTNTFLAKPGLIQLADLHGVYLIDPLTITDLTALVSILENPNIIKIMHSMSEDVDLLFHNYGVQLKQVFDTQIASAFAGCGAFLGYQNLVSSVLHLELDKGETRSDWLQRPLTERQLSYAALDALYLIKLYEKLEPVLAENGYLSALFEETDFSLAQYYKAWQEPERAYLKVRGGWELPEADQRLLQALVMWRDQTAFQENIPKPWVFNDVVLIEMARLKPSNINEIRRIRDVSGKSIKQFSTRVLELIDEFQPDEECFQLIEPPVKPTEMAVYRKLKAVVAEVARQTGLPAQLLGSRKLLEALVVHAYRNKHLQLIEEFDGWRHHLLAKGFENALAGNSE